MSRLRTLMTRALDSTPRALTEAVQSRPGLKRALRPLVNRVVTQGESDVQVQTGGGEGLRLRVDLSREKYYWTGEHERHLQAALQDALRPGMTMWDVGAHIGFFALQASRLVGPSGSVRAFEPMPDNRLRLEANIAANSAHNVVVVPEAVSATPGDATMYARSGSSLMWTLDADADDLSGETRHVRVTTLDELASSEDEVPALIKIDAEGAELDVLRGSRQLIAARNTTFLVEFMTAALLEEARTLMPRYEFKLLGDNHWLVTPSSGPEARPA